jgi:hypothetical protein
VRLSIPLVVKVPHSCDAATAAPRPILCAGKHVQGGLRAILRPFRFLVLTHELQQVARRTPEGVAELAERVSVDA